MKVLIKFQKCIKTLRNSYWKQQQKILLVGWSFVFGKQLTIKN